MDNKELDKLLAWGQYLHWSNILFDRIFNWSGRNNESVDIAISEDERFALSAQWLSSLYVVIEGWQQNKYTDDIITELINRYPDYLTALRRFRNGVYHYQPEILDAKMHEFLQFGGDSFNWSVALHVEFQRYLWQWPDRFRGSYEAKELLKESIEMCIGWFPADIPAVKKSEIAMYCEAAKRMVENSDDPKSPHCIDLLKTVSQIGCDINSVNTNPLLDLLKRLPNRL